MRFTASNDKPNMFRGFYTLLLAASRTHTHARTHSGTCTRNQSASMSTLHIQLSTFHCSHPAASGNHSVNVNVNLRLVACPMPAQAKYLRMLSWYPFNSLSLSYTQSLCASVRLCAVTFVMKLKCMLHACRKFLLCLPLLTLRRLTVAASADVAVASRGTNLQGEKETASLLS